jgi:hypothetical protein
MGTPARFSTCTVLDSNRLVPWLAAAGPLAYSPAAPPTRDYFFQYTWILPGIFSPEVDRREHRYFGSPFKDSARFLFEFWTDARRWPRAAVPLYDEPGRVSEDELRTPLAAYHHIRTPFRIAGAVLMQHGSYQWVPAEDQPHLGEGEVLLYRGIGDAPVFRQLRFRPVDLSAPNREVWRQYLALQAELLSDSVLSFNTIHDRVKRCETAGLLDGTWLADTLARRTGLEIDAPGFAQDLWASAQQSYSLDPEIGRGKFGPHSVQVKTALNNLRITTFFAGESEVRIVDPSRILDVQTLGCEVQFIPPVEP